MITRQRYGVPADGGLGTPQQGDILVGILNGRQTVVQNALPWIMSCHEDNHPKIESNQLLYGRRQHGFYGFVRLVVGPQEGIVSTTGSPPHDRQNHPAGALGDADRRAAPP